MIVHFFINYVDAASTRQEEFASCGKSGRFLTSTRQPGRATEAALHKSVLRTIAPCYSMKHGEKEILAGRINLGVFIWQAAVYVGLLN